MNPSKYSGLDSSSNHKSWDRAYTQTPKSSRYQKTIPSSVKDEFEIL